MQPAYYNDAFRSYFPAARQSNSMPMSTPLVSPQQQQQQPIAIPPPVSVPVFDPSAHVQNTLDQFQEKLFADLNAWKQATAASLAETSKSATPYFQTQQPVHPAAYFPQMMHVPYMYPSPPQLAVGKPSSDNTWKPFSCSNLSSVVLCIILVMFFVVAIVLILVYLSKLTIAVNHLPAILTSKTYRDT